MALPPRFAAHRLGFTVCGVGSAASAIEVGQRHTLELFADYVCPFSARIYRRVMEEVMPWLEEAHPGKVEFVFRHQVQPWHPQSALCHEVCLLFACIPENLHENRQR